jgi:mannose-1-phosphate guanylyltransferase/mannose-6-phosphate isomerase
MVILPSDHFVPDGAAFSNAIKTAARLAAQGWWVTLGIRPDRPSSAYGYIAPGSNLGTDDVACQVARFIEKPDPETAVELLDEGCLWNAGIFVVQAQMAADLIEKHAPNIHAVVHDAVATRVTDQRFERLGSKPFGASPSISIDYAVLEKEPRVAVIPYDGAWSDLGSWDSVAKAHAADDHGNRSAGDVWFMGSTECFVHSPDRLTVVLGLDNVVVVDTADALLVSAKDKTEQVKQVVDELKVAERPEFEEHRQVARPWGHYEGIDRGERYQVKRITVKPGAQLSLQYHHHRAEHWIVVRGTAKVTREGDTFLLHENESTYIPLGAVHRLENPGKTDLELIEVQSGSYLGEDDIVRVEDVYGRKADDGSNRKPKAASRAKTARQGGAMISRPKIAHSRSFVASIHLSRW